MDHSGQVDTNVVGPIEVIWKQAPKRDAGGDVVEDDTVHLSIYRKIKKRFLWSRCCARKVNSLNCRAGEDLSNPNTG